MARTILELSQEVCDRATVNRPTTIFGTNDRNARILKVAAADTLRDMMRDAMRNGISGFHSQWVFATVSGVYAYPLPPDFYRMLPGTEQRGSWPLGIIGPVTPQTWSGWISGAGYTAVPMGWRIKNNLIHFEPVPSASELIVIEYLSRFPVARDATDEDLAPSGGYLTPISPLVPREGYIAPGALGVVDSDGGSEWGTATWGTGVWGPTPYDALRLIPPGSTTTRFPAYQVRASGFTSDTDKSALDDDHVLSLGMTWRLKRGLMMPYAQDQDDYEREKDVFLASDASRGRMFTFGGEGSTYREVEPLGSGNWLVS